jgi:hypothetical protein
VCKNGEPGIGPQLIEKGDVIAICYGARAPYVLRPSDGDSGFRLLGTCVLIDDDIMEGQAMTNHIESGEPDVDIWIY